MNRRNVVFGALAFGALGCGPAAAIGHLPLPTGTMALTRRIERGLSDGASIIVERTWNILFSRQGSGASITGQQSRSKVYAPPPLARLAQIEESRSTEAMFPILLNENGILAAAGHYILEQDLSRAVQEAERAVRARKLAPDKMEEQLGYLGILQRSAGKLIEMLPGDLFYPTMLHGQTIEPVTLGEGQKGEFELTFEASRAPGKPWLARCERSIITRLGTSEQRSREVWTMDPV